MNKYIWKIKHFRLNYDIGVKIILLALFSALFFLLYVNMTTLSMLYHNFSALYNDDLQFYSFYVGQGESSLVIADGVSFLYDTGTEEYADNLCAELEVILDANNLDDIDYLILSHPHIDHTGGAEKILKRFNVRNIFRPTVVSPFEENDENYPLSSDIDYISLIKTIFEEDANVLFIKPQEIKIGDTLLKFWTPQKEKYSDENLYSPIVTISALGKTIMLTGDSTSEVDEEFLSALGDEELYVDILKVQHHGSRTASSVALLSEIHPFLAVISAGVDNSYNFPAQEVINRLNDVGAYEIFVTKDNGTIGLSLLSSSYEKADGFIFHDNALLITLYFVFFFMIAAIKFPHKLKYNVNYKNILR